MCSNANIKDINDPWFQTPDDFISSYFESNEKEFQEWIFENFKLFLEDVDLYEKGPEWNALKWKILEDGSSQYNQILADILDEYRENTTPESFTELKKLKSGIVRDCEFFLIKNHISWFDAEEYAGMKYVDFAHLPWNGKKYPVWIESIYDGTIRKIDVLLEYFESIDFTDPSTQTIKTETEIIPEGTNEKKKTVKQICLIHAFEGPAITKINSQKIAESNGKKSGVSLFREYKKLDTRKKRTASPGTERSLKERIKLFESVIPFLQEHNKDELDTEISVLKNRL